MISPSARATQHRILDAAQSCFAQRGYAGTSLRWVAENAGVTQPLVSHYFGTKERLFEAVLERSMADYEVVQAAQFARDLGDPDFVPVGLTVLFRWLKHQREVMRLLQWARLEDRMPALGASAEIWSRVRARLGALVKQGVLRDDVDLDSVMLFIDAAMKGFWDRRDEYAALAHTIDADIAHELERECERTFLLSLIRAFFTPAHQQDAEARVLSMLQPSEG
ncbi:MAG: helix-turn-helix domain-containing protein [Myxococcota bacterium]